MAAHTYYGDLSRLSRMCAPPEACVESAQVASSWSSVCREFRSLSEGKHS